MKHKGKLIGFVIGLVVSVLGCIAHSVECEPNIFIYYIISIWIIWICIIIGAGIDSGL